MPKKIQIYIDTMITENLKTELKREKNIEENTS